MIKAITTRIRKALHLRWMAFLLRVQRRARKRSLKKALDEAKVITLETGKKVLIYLVNGEYIVMTKQQMKQKWKDKHFIGYTVQEIENMATTKTEKFNYHATRKNVNVRHQERREETAVKTGS